MSRRAKVTLTAALVALLGAASAGCSILNKPDRNQIRFGTDAGTMDSGGVDAGVDAGDGGVDAEVLDGGCARYQPQETRCDNDLDDDCDGFTDCEDNAGCGSAAVCCTMGSSVSTMWTSTTPTGWAPLPRAPGDITVASGTITSFGSSGDTQAIERTSCTPIVLGLRVTAVLTPIANDCTAGTCASYAGIVLTGARAFPPTGPLLDDLRVAMRSDGIVEVTQNRVVVAASMTPVAPSEDATVEIELSLGGDAAGSPVVFARIGIQSGETILQGEPLIPLGQLVSTGTCADGPGLYIAVEGANSNVHVGTVTVEQLQCANPSRFTAPPGPTMTTLSGSEVGAGGWANGGIGAPSLASYADVGGDPRYDLLFDATDRARSNETFERLIFAIGRAHAPDVTDVWVAAHGGTPPVLSEPSGVREPFLLREPLDGTGRPFSGVLNGYYAFVPDAGSPDVYALARFTTASGGDADLVAVAGSTLAAGALGAAVDPWSTTTPPATLPACVSLRDPALALAGDVLSRDGYWLFFTCVRDTGRSDIRALRLEATFAPRSTTPVVVMTPERLGVAGELGLRSPEPIFKHADMTPSALRVWFVATARSGATAVWLAQSQYEAGGTPGFELYPINPVLTPDSPGIACGPGCSVSLSSLAVARRIDETDTLQFLLARSVDRSSGTREFDLVPLQQTLELFWQ